MRQALRFEIHTDYSKRNKPSRRAANANDYALAATLPASGRPPLRRVWGLQDARQIIDRPLHGRTTLGLLRGAYLMFWRGGKEPGPGNEQTLTDLVTRVLRLFFPVEPDHELNRLKQENIRLKHQNERLRYHFYHSMRDLGAAEPGDYPEAQRP